MVGAVPPVAVEEDLMRRVLSLEPDREELADSRLRPDRQPWVEPLDVYAFGEEVQLGLRRNSHGNECGERCVLGPRA